MKVTVVGGDPQMRALTEDAFRRALPSGVGHGMSVKLTVTTAPVPPVCGQRPLQTPDFPFDALEVTRRASVTTTPPWYQRVWSALKRWMALD